MKKSCISNYRKLLLPLALSLCVTAHAQDAWVATRTHASLQNTGSQVVTLTAAHHPTIEAARVSELESGKPMHVSLSLNLRNVTELETFLEDVNNPHSPLYQQFLTPEQFKARFAPTDDQVKAVIAHLTAYGFHHVEVASNNMLVSADGNAAAVNAAFHAQMKTFTFKNKQHYANGADVTVPAALGEIVDAVVGLQDYAKPHTLMHRASDKSMIAAAAGEVAHNPTDFASIYDAGSTPTASKTVVGIITWGDLSQTISDLATFTMANHLPTVNTHVSPGSAGTLAVDQNAFSEWNLDSQSIIGISGGVKQLVFYTAVNGDSQDSGLTNATLMAAYNKAVTENVAKVINVSLGGDETAAHNDGSQAADDKVFAQAVAQGQTFSIASGDEGVYGWSNDPTEGAQGYVANGNGVVQIDLSHYSVEEPATSPYVIAVGGTTLKTIGSKTWAGETVWNEGLSYVDETNGDFNERLWASTGGVSLFETAPSWQTRVLGANVTKRQLPDVAFDAALSTGANIYLQGQAQAIGGTSLASPLFVGVWARMESAHNNTLGMPARNMYIHFNKHKAPLHDVVSGNNGYEGHGYNAKVGYDNTTGWGSLNISAFDSYITKYW
ncbi:S53 family peptidase [Dyella acidisoli]|uniref:Sedolisin-B n=1 Tax=Dyella acidisoli TaxID=1867834 RepID=A0ABQ5XPI7_9GAMM|nr:S53 family serine peptidase [Dyella acidisoli]GLQ93614.1 sedolisin-B [Dyella acidisoli]